MSIYEGLRFSDIQILPRFSSINSRKEVSLKTKLSRNIEIDYPLILSPMDTVSSVESCVAMNSMGAAGILHRFMPIEEQVDKAEQIKKQSGKCYVAIGLKDYEKRISALWSVCTPNLFVLDCANGLMDKVRDFTIWFKENYPHTDVTIGNTLTKESVSRAISIGADSVRHSVGTGSACLTSSTTGIGCPPVTALHYAWKAVRNWQLAQDDIRQNPGRPSILLDGGIREPGDLTKAIVAGADAVICGGIFAGCKETPGEIFDKIQYLSGRTRIEAQADYNRLPPGEHITGKFKKFRGMASKEVVEEYDLWDGNKENLFVEGKETLVPYTGESVVDVVHRFSNGLRSCLSYLNSKTIEEVRGGIWDDRVIAIKVSK